MDERLKNAPNRRILDVLEEHVLSTGRKRDTAVKRYGRGSRAAKRAQERASDAIETFLDGNKILKPEIVYIQPGPMMGSFWPQPGVEYMARPKRK
ncbi:MAG: hypothetical protein AAB573_03685 [Patescibacteria group bacterium]